MITFLTVTPVFDPEYFRQLLLMRLASHTRNWPRQPALPLCLQEALNASEKDRQKKVLLTQDLGQKAWPM